MIQNTMQFLREVRMELAKVTWPAWKPISPKTELWESTLIVIMTVSLLAAFIGIVDVLLTQLVGLVLR